MFIYGTTPNQDQTIFIQPIIMAVGYEEGRPKRYTNGLLDQGGPDTYPILKLSMHRPVDIFDF